MTSRRRVEQREVRRLEQRPWKDPRVLLGIVLVLGSTVLGSLAFAAQDDTSRYWAVRADVEADDPVTRDDLVATSARLTGDAAERALAVGEDLPGRLSDLAWSHGMRGGTLVDEGDLVRASDRTVVELPLAVSAGAAPTDLRPGQLVDVWVGPGSGDAAGTEQARRVLSGVPIVSVRRTGAGTDGAGSTVVVDTRTREIAAGVVAGVGSAHVTVVRHS